MPCPDRRKFEEDADNAKAARSTSRRDEGSKGTHPMPVLFWRSTLGSARCVREMRKLMVDAGKRKATAA